ncbi:MAG: FHA domain-containing protein [Candidatus Rokubacteria bacterium]|nr:FHA domain-containing protein [Candidatus Rokubacteria bacterium]
MPQVTLVMERTPVQVYTLDRPVIRIGRVEGMDIVIDNVSVSRAQAEIRQEGKVWTVRDLGSANGTFLNGQRLTAPQALQRGDEISFGKFSLFFDRVLTEPLAEVDVTPKEGRANPPGTYHLSAEDVERLQQAISVKRQAQVEWEVAGTRGTHFVRGGAVLVGCSRLCDLRLPVSGPKQHILIIRGEHGFEIRNLSRWHRMRVNGEVKTSAPLKSKDIIEVGRARLTFLDQV